MLNIPKKIECIEELLAQDTVQSLTYASLECRLTIEFLCYERLVSSHKYFSQDDLKTWTPKSVVQQIAAEANELITEGLTVSISRGPNKPGSEPATVKEFEALEYIKIGEQIHLNVSKLGSLHNALSNLALHIHIPKAGDAVQFYGSDEKIRKKIEEALVHFRALAKGTLLAGSFGMEWSFPCEVCGAHIRRKSELLKDQQVISCFNPHCAETYLIHGTGDRLEHSRRTIDVTCIKCKGVTSLPTKTVERLRFGEKLPVSCPCGHPAFVELFPRSVSPKWTPEDRALA